MQVPQKRNSFLIHLNRKHHELFTTAVSTLGVITTLASPKKPFTTTHPPPPPLTHHLRPPLTQRIPPVSSHEHPADDIDNLDEKHEEAVPVLDDGQPYGLNVVLYKDAGDGVLADLLALLRDGVLVCLDVLLAPAVHRGDYGDVVLEFVEVVLGGVDGAVEGVDEGGVEGAVGELGDDVREVELCRFSVSKGNLLSGSYSGDRILF